MKPLVRVATDRRDDVVVVGLRGEVDISNVGRIRSEIASEVSGDVDCLVLDLTETVYLDSAAVRLLFELAEQLRARRKELRLVASDATLVRRVLVLTHIGDQVPFHASVDEALAGRSGD